MKLRITGLPRASEYRQKEINTLIAELRNELKDWHSVQIDEMELKVTDLITYPPPKEEVKS